MTTIIVKDDDIVLVEKKFYNKIEAQEFLALLDQSYAGYEITVVEDPHE